MEKRPGLRFFTAIVVAFIILTLLHQTVWAQLLPPTPDIAWVQALQQKKLRAARKMDSPKIVIIGGSEAHYGLSAAILSDKTGLPAVNLGTHAGLDWSTHIELAKPVLNPGDVVLFSANYNLVNSTARAMQVEYWRQTDPLFFLREPLRYWPAYLGGDVIRQTLITMLQGDARENSRDRAGRITNQGDEVRNVVEDGRDPAHLRHLNQVEPPIGGYMGERTHAVAVLEEFADWARRNEVRLYIVFPAHMDMAEYKRGTTYALTFSQLNQLMRRLKLETLNNAWKTAMPREFFFDTPFHPTGEGRDRFTREIAERLVRELEA